MTDSNTVSQLREKHSTFTYVSYEHLRSEQSEEVFKFTYTISPDITLQTEIVLPQKSSAEICTVKEERLIFLLGMVEMISYWKLTCSAEIRIECGNLSEEEKGWWEKLIRNGLGEFFFLNNISPQIPFSITTKGVENRDDAPFKESPKQMKPLILIGGGKDSLVTLTAISSRYSEYGTLSVNPIPASLDAVRELQVKNQLVVKRTLDPKISVLNQQGYLNGHIPYSAVLAFLSTLVACQNGYTHILTSNESSASEANTVWNGNEINHQYSKSIDFEEAFRGYPFGFILPCEYLSFLRPLNELQITALLCEEPKLLPIFRSCNREQRDSEKKRVEEGRSVGGNKRAGWCGECPKCVFTYLCLIPFLELSAVDSVFGSSPLKNPGFVDQCKALAGFGDHKPFECVGTFVEVRAAIAELVKKLLLQSEFQETCTQLKAFETDKNESVQDLLRFWDARNSLSEEFQNLLQERLKRVKISK